MTIDSPLHASESGVLPQHGFRSDTSLQSLLLKNPYLFRVYTPKERSPFFDDTDPYFLAPKFNDKHARSPVEIRNHQRFTSEWDVDYADVAKHMDWTTRVASPFISTSLSFAWCIWDALRRFHQGVKKDVQVAIIDGRAVADRAATTIELLELSSPSQRNKDYRKWHRFSEESQSVLVYGSIPGTAVLASIPLLSILRHLPSYFLKPGLKTIDVENPLTGLGWDYTEKKLGYRQFCRNMSSCFYGLDTEQRLADSTAGSLTLSLAFLRPWFHQTVDVDCDLAVRTLTGLASIIAQWPGQWWVRERPEIYDLTYAMALTLCQELRERHKFQAQGEVSRLQGVVNELCEVVKEYEVRFNSTDKRTGTNQSKKQKPTLFINPIAPVFSPPTCSSVSFPARPGSTSTRVQTPLTPPDTPKSTSFISQPSVSSTTAGRFSKAGDRTTGPSLSSAAEFQRTSSRGVPNTPLSAAAAFSINALANQSILPSQTSLSDISSNNLTVPTLGSIALTPSPAQHQSSHTSSSAASDLQPQEIPLPPSPFHDSPVALECQSRNSLPSPSSIADDDSWTMILSQVDDLSSDDDDDDTQVDEDSSYRKELQDSIITLRETEVESTGSPTLVIAPLPAATSSSSKGGPEYLPPRPRSGIFAEPLEFDYTQVDFIQEPTSRRSSMLETAGRFATGFLIGAFITVAIFSPQRRMIIHLT